MLLNAAVRCGNGPLANDYFTALELTRQGFCLRAFTFAQFA
jgi:hypothetical protein